MKADFPYGELESISDLFLDKEIRESRERIIAEEYPDNKNILRPDCYVWLSPTQYEIAKAIRDCIERMRRVNSELFGVMNWGEVLMTDYCQALIKGQKISAVAAFEVGLLMLPPVGTEVLMQERLMRELKEDRSELLRLLQEHKEKNSGTKKRHAQWQEAVDQLYQKNNRLTHNGICTRLASRFGVAPDTIRRKTTLNKK